MNEVFVQSKYNNSYFIWLICKLPISCTFGIMLPFDIFTLTFFFISLLLLFSVITIILYPCFWLRLLRLEFFFLTISSVNNEESGKNRKNYSKTVLGICTKSSVGPCDVNSVRDHVTPRWFLYTFVGKLNSWIIKPL